MGGDPRFQYGFGKSPLVDLDRPRGGSSEVRCRDFARSAEVIEPFRRRVVLQCVIRSLARRVYAGRIGRYPRWFLGVQLLGSGYSGGNLRAIGKLANGRYAYRVPCPWDGKNGKKLTAFKFCSAAAYKAWQAKSEHSDETGDREHSEDDDREIT